MNDETFNLSIRKFLKMVGINSQREIEQAVARAMADGSIAGRESFPAHVIAGGARLEDRRHVRRRDQARITRQADNGRVRPAPASGGSSRRLSPSLRRRAAAQSRILFAGAFPRQLLGAGELRLFGG